MQKSEIIELIDKAMEKALGYFTSNDFPNAEEVYRQILRVDPSKTDAISMLSLTTAKNGNTEEAINMAENVVKNQPNDFKHHNNLALIYGIAKDKRAIDCFRKAIILAPDKAFLYTNLAIEYKKHGELERAEKVFQTAMAVNPNNEHVLFNYGAFLQEFLRLEEAISLYKKALRVNNNFPVCHYNLSACYFLLGDYLSAWPEYEWRWEYFPQFANVKSRFNQPYWRGEKCKRLLLYTEQGIGDSLMFIRYLKLLSNMEVYVECIPDLKEIFSASFPQIKFVDKVDFEFDYHCSLLSLPLIFGTKPDNIPFGIYLKSNKEINEESWEPYKNYFKIGIAWAGNRIHPNDNNRSIPLKIFKEVENLPNVKLFSFQKHRADLSENTEDMKIIDMREHLKDFNCTAGLLQKMDLVISADTAVAHLAAALGKVTWILIPNNPDWRWLLEGEKTHWYPSVRLIRQRGEWAETVRRLSKELSLLTGRPCSQPTTTEEE